MKLRCSVCVSNREAPNGQIRHVKSSLVVGVSPRRPGSYALTLFTATNKGGVEYPLDGNVDRVFCKFWQEGKATIKLRRPPHDLLLRQCDPPQLSLFLKCLGSCVDGTVGANPDTPKPANRAVAANAADLSDRTKTVVLRLSDMPVQGFSKRLRTLQINSVKMRNLNKSILGLICLKSLNLNDNRLERLPKQLGDLPNLEVLHLSRNRLALSQRADWQWTQGKIIERLKLLDLSHNDLDCIPNSITKMKRLVTLKLNNNNLKCLPGAMGNLKQLGYLHIQNNLLTSLPASLSSLKLQTLDVSANPPSSRPADANIVNYKFKVGRLVDIASTFVIKRNIHYANDIIPYTLVNYLDDRVYCACGAGSFNFDLGYLFIASLKPFCVTIICNGCYDATFQGYFCSFKCYKAFTSTGHKSQQNS